jgi:hypothetical protein
MAAVTRCPGDAGLQYDEAAMLVVATDERLFTYRNNY